MSGEEWLPLCFREEEELSCPGVGSEDSAEYVMLKSELGAEFLLPAF